MCLRREYFSAVRIGQWLAYKGLQDNSLVLMRLVRVLEAELGKKNHLLEIKGGEICKRDCPVSNGWEQVASLRRGH